MKPFIVLALVLAALSGRVVSAQAVAASTPDSASTMEKPYRNPERAAAFALIPGWGYFYTGEYFRGYMVWLTTVTGLAFGSALLHEPCIVNFSFTLEPDPCTRGERMAGTAIGVGMTVAGLLTWIFSMRDARASAERANVRHGRLSPVFAPSTVTAGQWRAGVAIDW